MKDGAAEPRSPVPATRLEKNLFRTEQAAGLDPGETPQVAPSVQTKALVAPPPPTDTSEFTSIFLLHVKTRAARAHQVLLKRLQFLGVCLSRGLGPACQGKMATKSCFGGARTRHTQV